MSNIVLSLDQADDYVGSVLAYGHFTTIHPGHIRYLRHARSLGDKFAVVLVGDGESEQSPYLFSQGDRAEALSLLGIADAIVLLKDNELTKAIEKLSLNARPWHRAAGFCRTRPTSVCVKATWR